MAKFSFFVIFPEIAFLGLQILYEVIIVLHSFRMTISDLVQNEEIRTTFENNWKNAVKLRGSTL